MAGGYVAGLLLGAGLLGFAAGHLSGARGRFLLGSAGVDAGVAALIGVTMLLFAVAGLRP